MTQGRFFVGRATHTQTVQNHPVDYLLSLEQIVSYTPDAKVRNAEVCRPFARKVGTNKASADRTADIPGIPAFICAL